MRLVSYDRTTKAEAYVRKQRPALMELTFGCEVKDTHNQQYYKVCNKSVNGDLFVSHGSLVSNQYRIAEDRIIIIGHPIALHHWLAVLPTSYELSSNGFLKEEINENAWDIIMQFNMDTGQPNSPQDYANFNQIVNNYG